MAVLRAELERAKAAKAAAASMPSLGEDEEVSLPRATGASLQTVMEENARLKAELDAAAAKGAAAPRVAVSCSCGGRQGW